MNFPDCQPECYDHGKIPLEYSITYYKTIELGDQGIHIGAIVMSNHSIIQKLPAHHHKFLLLFNRKKSDKLPDNTRL